MSMRSHPVLSLLVLGLLGFPYGSMRALAQDNPELVAAHVPAGPFDTFVLAMSDEDDFCAENPSKKECKNGTANYGMALHGLWPNRNSDSQHNYQYCGSVTNAQLEKDWCSSEFDIRSQLSDGTFAGLANVMPGTQSCLYNHEWYAHGTCSGLSPDQYFGDAQEVAKKFIALPHFHTLIANRAGKTVSKAELIGALTADLGADAAGSILVDCRKAGHGSETFSFTEVDLTLDGAQFMKFPARESLGAKAGDDQGNCPAQGIVITPPGSA